MRAKLLFISTFLFFALAIVAQHSQYTVNPIKNTVSYKEVLSIQNKDISSYAIKSVAEEEMTDEGKEVKTNVLIYPNPSNGNFTVSLENKRQIQNLEIYNVVGERILQQHLSNQVSIPNAQTGIYFVKIDDGYTVYTKRITVQ